MKSPLFTVLIPTYNRSILLHDAVKSVMMQTFKDFELILVDDYSTENIKELADSFNDKRISYMLNTRSKGVAGARNAGIRRARGQWVAFLDSDDIWLPRKLELTQKKISTLDEQTGLIYTGYAEYDFIGNRKLSVHMPQKQGWIKKDLLYKNYIGTFSTVVARSDLLKAVDGCDERMNYSEDLDLYIRIAALSKIDYLKEVLTLYRTANDDRLGYKYGEQMKGHKILWEKYGKIIDDDPKLKSRAASRVFLSAVALGDPEELFKTLPLTLSCIFYDLPNFLQTFKITMSIVYDKIFCHSSMNKAGLQ